MDPLPAAVPFRAANLWNEFAAPLRSFVAKRAPRELEPDDLLQDIFVRIQAQLPKLRDVERVDAWIFQIARNVVADAFRKRRRVDALDDRDGGEPAEPATVAEEPTGEASLLSCLAAMIAQLPEPYRHAIELTEICGLTQAEAARQVGISLPGMKSRVQRGREQLARIIHGTCAVETDVRGHVIECDPHDHGGCGSKVCGGLHPSPGSHDSMDMNTNPTLNNETTPIDQEAKSGCCGGPAPDSPGACCALDAEVKQAGGSGCGCGATKAQTSAAGQSSKKGCC